jgi:hypothetical protein
MADGQKYSSTVIDLHGESTGYRPISLLLHRGPCNPVVYRVCSSGEKLLAFFRWAVHVWDVIVTIDLRNSSSAVTGVTFVGDEAHESMTG